MTRRTFAQMAVVPVAAVAQSALPPKPSVTSSVSLSMLTGELARRLETAARSGVQAIELGPEYRDWTPAELSRNRKWIRSYGFAVDTLAGPDLRARPEAAAFFTGLRRALDVAGELEAANLVLLVTNPDAFDFKTVRQAADLAQQHDLTLVCFSPPDGAAGRNFVAQVDHRRFRFAATVPDVAGHPQDVEEKGLARVLYVTRNPVEPDVYRAVRKAGFSGTFCFNFKAMGADETEVFVRAIDAMRDALRAS